MINIFHGENQVSSRNAFLEFINNYSGDILRLDHKQIDINKINNFLMGQSFFQEQKMLTISNFFSIPKANLDKLINIFKKSDIEITIWQDKKLSDSQLKSLGKINNNIFNLDKNIFLLLKQIIPKNSQKFFIMYDEILKNEPFDLIFFWIKKNIRQQIKTYTRFDKNILKKNYLKLIDLDYHNKKGQLNTSREVLLKQILLELLS